ncbi:hypothetical protein Btru_032832 [Bulinus truncatus]|nr:hypothetical protein Btru_032832 [Bulinus truncatus]
MIRRKPTRIELKIADIEEYDSIKKEREAASKSSKTDEFMSPEMLTAKKRMEAVHARIEGLKLSATPLNQVLNVLEHRLNGQSYTCKDSFLEIQLDSVTLKIPLIWLRDHCTSKKFYNHRTEQKIPQRNLSVLDLTPENIFYTDNQNAISVTWKDGHVSTYDLEWLTDNFYPGKLISPSKRTYWNKEIISSDGLPVVSYEEHVNTESGLKSSLANLVKYGFTVVDGTPVSQEATQTVAERISFILKTVFGEMWAFTADASRSDTAYTTQNLGAHTDNSYLSVPAGIQVFHCLQHDGTGGETLLVDGFNALDVLKKTDRAAFNILATLAVPHQYKERASANIPGNHLHSVSPVAAVHPTSGEYICLRFNPYDRAPLNTVSPEDMAAFYEAYEKLSEIISSQQNELWFKLNKGSVLLVDNWRVLHGRAAFDGNRFICGCYLPRDEWISKARMVGLL